VARTAAPAPNDPASMRNGSEGASENSRPPLGGPTKEVVTTSAAYSRPLARSKSPVPTSAGIIAWAALSKTVSAQPSANPAA
jgi:hypothetical protein